MSPSQKRPKRDASAGRPRAAPRVERGPFEPHAHERPDDGTAFMPDPEGGPALIQDDLAEGLAEEFIAGATRGSEPTDESLDGVVPEELGGPFIETSAAEEFANDIDDMNPPDTEPEPLPRPIAGLVSRSTGQADDAATEEEEEAEELDRKA